MKTTAVAMIMALGGVLLKEGLLPKNDSYEQQRKDGLNQVPRIFVIRKKVQYHKLIHCQQLQAKCICPASGFPRTNLIRIGTGMINSLCTVYRRQL